MTPPPTAVEARPEVVTRTGTAQQTRRLGRARHQRRPQGRRPALPRRRPELPRRRAHAVRADAGAADRARLDADRPGDLRQLLSASGVTFLMLFCVPMVLAIAGYVVPLQIGARGVAFPRLNLLSAWLYIAGGVVLYASFALHARRGRRAGPAPALGHRLQPRPRHGQLDHGRRPRHRRLRPASRSTWSSPLRRMRAPGMAWRRLPLFTWAATVISYVLVVVGPVMLAALAMLTIDRHFDGVFFDAGEGGAPLLYQHLVYIFMTGIYAIVVLFAAGVISEILPDVGPQADLQPPRRRRLARRDRRPGAARLDAEHVLGADPRGLGVHGDGAALALLVPIGRCFFIWIATLWGGTRSACGAPLLYAAAAISRIALGLARRARLLGDPGRLAARQHHRLAGRHALRPRRRRRVRRLRGAPLLAAEDHRPRASARARPRRPSA